MDSKLKVSRDKWLAEKDRRDGLANLFYFSKFVLGYNLQTQPHEEICEFVQSPDPFKLLLVPRQSFKTSIASQAYPIWLLERNPNERILLDSEVLRNSQRNLQVIKNIYEGGERFKFLFGDRVNKDMWNQDEITIATRSNKLIKEPSIGTAGIDTVQVGPHYSTLIIDDIHSEKNSRTKDQIDIVHEHLKLLFSLGSAGETKMLVLATRWSDADVYGRIIEQHTKFKLMVRKAIDDKGRLYFPSLLTKEVLDQLRADQGPDLWNCQYQNDPMPQGETATFKKEGFRYSKTYPAKMRLTIFCDPSIGATKDHDYFALLVAGLDENNQMWVVDYLYGNWQPHEGVQKLFLLAQKHTQVTEMAIETIAFQKILKFNVEAEMRKLNKFWKLTEIKSHSKSKIDRIMGLQPRYEQGAVTHMEWMRGGELEEELLKFPRGRKRDVADALSFAMEVLKPKTLKKVIPPHADPGTSTVDNLINMALQDEWKKRNIAVPHPQMGSQW